MMTTKIERVTGLSRNRVLISLALSGSTCMPEFALAQPWNQIPGLIGLLCVGNQVCRFGAAVLFGSVDGSAPGSIKNCTSVESVVICCKKQNDTRKLVYGTGTSDW